MKRLATLLAVTASLASMTACEPSRSSVSPDTATESPLGAWLLRSLGAPGNDEIAVPDPTQYRLELTGDGRAHIQADCNVCGSDYRSAGSSLTFGLMACTAAACGPDSLDQLYVSALETSSTFHRSGNTLVLSYDGGVLRFRAR